MEKIENNLPNFDIKSYTENKNKILIILEELNQLKNYSQDNLIFKTIDFSINNLTIKTKFWLNQ